MSPFKATDQQGRYYLEGTATTEDIVAFARKLIARKMTRGRTFTSPTAVREFLTLEIGQLEHEVFHVLFLDTRHRLIAFEEMFRGTIDGASVYPREVVKRSLQLNASAVIFAHNHPSGVPEPSRDDRALTTRLTEALGLVGVRVLDHCVVGGVEVVSMAERGDI